MLLLKQSSSLKVAPMQEIPGGLNVKVLLEGFEIGVSCCPLEGVGPISARPNSFRISLQEHDAPAVLAGVDLNSILSCSL